MPQLRPEPTAQLEKFDYSVDSVVSVFTLILLPPDVCFVAGCH